MAVTPDTSTSRGAGAVSWSLSSAYISRLSNRSRSVSTPEVVEKQLISTDGANTGNPYIGVVLNLNFFDIRRYLVELDAGGRRQLPQDLVEACASRTICWFVFLPSHAIKRVHCTVHVSRRVLILGIARGDMQVEIGTIVLVVLIERDIYKLSVTLT